MAGSRAGFGPPLTRLDAERRRRHGVRLIGGVDEAGRGPLAGPVVAACVVLGPGTRLPGLDDSKKLDAATREQLAPLILERAVGWGLGLATHREIDAINILQATLRAAGRALAMLPADRRPEYLITDYLKLAALPFDGAACPVESLAKADAKSQAVAAASVLAKVARDRIMKRLDAQFPQYGFAGHKGYGAPKHLAALREHGPCPIHRLTFAGVLPEPFFGEEGRTSTIECQRKPDLEDYPCVNWLSLLTPECGL
jgi:ribonuclease HII